MTLEKQFFVYYSKQRTYLVPVSGNQYSLIQLFKNVSDISTLCKRKVCRLMYGLLTLPKIFLNNFFARDYHVSLRNNSSSFINLLFIICISRVLYRLNQFCSLLHYIDFISIFFFWSDFQSLFYFVYYCFYFNFRSSNTIQNLPLSTTVIAFVAFEIVSLRTTICTVVPSINGFLVWIFLRVLQIYFYFYYFVVSNCCYISRDSLLTFH